MASIDTERCFIELLEDPEFQNSVVEKFKEKFDKKYHYNVENEIPELLNQLAETQDWDEEIDGEFVNITTRLNYVHEVSDTDDFIAVKDKNKIKSFMREVEEIMSKDIRWHGSEWNEARKLVEKYT